MVMSISYIWSSIWKERSSIGLLFTYPLQLKHLKKEKETIYKWHNHRATIEQSKTGEVKKKKKRELKTDLSMTDLDGEWGLNKRNASNFKVYN